QRHSLVVVGYLGRGAGHRPPVRRSALPSALVVAGHPAGPAAPHPHVQILGTRLVDSFPRRLAARQAGRSAAGLPAFQVAGPRGATLPADVAGLAADIATLILWPQIETAEEKLP